MKEKTLKLIKQELVSNETLRGLFGENIDKLITFKPSLNVTELNSEYKADRFITLSFNRAADEGESSVWLLKVGVAISTEGASDDKILSIYTMLKEVIATITKRDLIYDMPEQFEFSQFDEAFFDNSQLTWGYVALFTVADVKIQTLSTI